MWYNLRVHIPDWVTIVVAVAVMIFGIYRLRMAARSRHQPSEAGAGGLRGLPFRTHLLFGIVYIAMGLALLARPLFVRLF